MKIEQKLIIVSLLPNGFLLSAVHLRFSPEVNAAAEANLEDEQCYQNQGVSVHHQKIFNRLLRLLLQGPLLAILWGALLGCALLWCALLGCALGGRTLVTC